jgi:hypothetical protein
VDITWIWLVRFAGAGQLGLALGSLAIPAVLGWKEETQRLGKLTRSVFSAFLDGVVRPLLR